MPGGNWGKKGTTRLEDDALFREIGDQLAGLGGENFDYSQWQRTHQLKSPSKSTNSGKEKPQIPKQLPKRPDTVQTGFTVSTTAPTLTSLRRIGSGSTCFHGARSKKEIPSADLEERKRKSERLKVLQLKIRSRRQTLTEYKKRYYVLLDENIKLKDNIETEEGDNHDKVKKLLRKYERFRGGIATLNDKFVIELSKVKADLEKTKIKTELDLQALQDQVDDMEVKLKEKQKELNVLMNYKDKEYPLKSLRIAELGKEIIDLKSQNQEEIDELQHIVDSEMDKHKKERNKVKKDITVKVTDELTKKMDPSWEDMALHNRVMEKEIEFHRKEMEDLESTIQELDREVKRLLKDPKTSIRQQMFPQFFPKLEKCTPDMDVVLDIPTQQWLPI